MIPTRAQWQMLCFLLSTTEALCVLRHCFVLISFHPMNLLIPFKAASELETAFRFLVLEEPTQTQLIA